MITGSSRAQRSFSLVGAVFSSNSEFLFFRSIATASNYSNFSMNPLGGRRLRQKTQKGAYSSKYSFESRSSQYAFYLQHRNH